MQKHDKNEENENEENGEKVRITITLTKKRRKEWKDKRKARGMSNMAEYMEKLITNDTGNMMDAQDQVSKMEANNQKLVMLVSTQMELIKTLTDEVTTLKEIVQTAIMTKKLSTSDLDLQTKLIKIFQANPNKELRLNEVLKQLKTPQNESDVQDQLLILSEKGTLAFNIDQWAWKYNAKV